MNKEDKLIFIYSKFKLLFLTTVLLFFVIFPLVLPSRINLQKNIYFVIAILVFWIASALFFIFINSSKRNRRHRAYRFVSTFFDLFFLGSILTILLGLNNNYFFLFAFFILGAAFYLDQILIIFAGSLSILFIVVLFFSQSNLASADYPLLIVKILFFVIITYFVYLFALSYREIYWQKKNLKKISSLNRNLLNNFTRQLRTPLPVIRDFLFLLENEKRGSLNKEQRKIISLLHEETKKLIEESSTLVYFDQLKTDDFYLHKVTVNLIDLLRDVILRLEDELQAKNNVIIYQPRKKKLDFYCDPYKFLSAINILLGEIILKADKGSSIKINSFRSDYSSYMELNFVYLGEPLSFEQKFSHKNLKLYVAREIIIKHGGSLHFDFLNIEKKLIITLPYS